MKSPALLLALLPAVFCFLSITVDKRIANEEGLLNPLLFLKQTVVVWKNNINKGDQEIWKKYMKHVRNNYGSKNATLVEPVSKMALDIYKQLPKRLKSTTDGILTGFQNGTYKFQPNVVNQLIKNRIEKELLPLAEKVFFNPFDQKNNEKLEEKDFGEIGLFTGK